MKRITTLLLAFVLTLGSMGVARADGVELKVKGTWDFAFGWIDNKYFTKSVNRTSGKDHDDDNFEARQRVRTQINFIASEYLQGVLMFEIGDLDWGRPGKGRQQGAGLDADATNIETKRAYLDWIIPNTEISVRMGIQGLKLPSTWMDNPVFDADVAGIVVSSPITDWLSATAFWIRPFDQYRNDNDYGGGLTNGKNSWSDSVDAFGLILPVTMDGWKVSPYFIYGFVGANSGLYDYLYVDYDNSNSVNSQNSNAKAWWGGLNFTMDMFNPLTFSFDAIYGHLQKADLQGLGRDDSNFIFYNNGQGLQGDTDWGSAGWYVAATLDYKLDFMTPGIFGWWASGDTESGFNGGHLGRIPVVGWDQGFSATSFGTDGYYSIGNGGNGPGVMQSAAGTWGVGIQLADISFIEDLTHTLRFAYYRGTNDSDLVKRLGGNAPLKYQVDNLYLTDKDSVFEVNFDHTYKIYENLTAVLELGYMHLSTDRSTWNPDHASNKSGLEESDDAWKAEVMFRYAF